MRSVVFCGSRRFKKEMRMFAAAVRKMGVQTYEPYLHSGQEEWKAMSSDYQNFVALGLTHDHFYKIKMADVVFIFNKDGYMGVSSTLELGYALALGKPVYAIHEDEELCRNVLFRGILNTPKKLAGVLRL